jgi:hypothetical protein
VRAKRCKTTAAASRALHVYTGTRRHSAIEGFETGQVRNVGRRKTRPNLDGHNRELLELYDPSLPEALV